MSSVSQRIDAVELGGKSLPIYFASVSAASSGDNTLVAAVSGYKIRVLAGSLVAAGAVTARFQSGAGGTALTGVQSLITGTPLPLPHCPLGHFETASGALLNLSLGGAVQVSGWLVYCLVPAST